MNLSKPNDLKRLLRIIRATAIWAIIMVLFPGIALAAPVSPLTLVSPGARVMAHLPNIILVIATLIFAIVCSLLIYSLLRFRRKSDDDPESGQNFPGNATLEIIWTMIPMLMLIGLLVLTFQALNNINPDPKSTDLTVKVTGKQWLWKVQYPAYDINLSGELKVPVNTGIKIELTSEDVIHSFWVPQLADKKNAIPGYLTTLRFKPEIEGTFWGECVEYCGLAHSTMSIKVDVVSQDNFDLWLAEQSEIQASAAAAD